MNQANLETANCTFRHGIHTAIMKVYKPEVDFANDCKQACADSMRCEGWNFNATKQACHFEYIEEYNHNSTVSKVSGAMPRTTLCEANILPEDNCFEKPGFKLIAEHEGRRNVEYPENCMEECREHNKCRVWSYDMVEKNCILYVLGLFKVYQIDPLIDPEESYHAGLKLC